MAKKTFSDLMPEAAGRIAKVSEKWDESRQCDRCNGSGEVPHWQWDICKKPEYQSRKEKCTRCNGMGHFLKPDLVALINAVTTTIGGRVRLRSSRPTYGVDRFWSRAYYVWRIARFDGGIDVTMPVMASMELGNDSYRDELDQLASAVASIFCGTDKAGALRWGALIGGLTDKEAADYRAKHPQPITAEPSGPVVIGTKPQSEFPELL